MEQAQSPSGAVRFAATDPILAVPKQGSQRDPWRRAELQHQLQTDRFLRRTPRTLDHEAGGKRLSRKRATSWIRRPDPSGLAAASALAYLAPLLFAAPSWILSFQITYLMVMFLKK